MLQLPVAKGNFRNHNLSMSFIEILVDEIGKTVDDWFSFEYLDSLQRMKPLRQNELGTGFY